jgi:hypothetical protein
MLANVVVRPEIEVHLHPTLADRTWVLITESPEGGWGIDGHANTGADIVAAARAALQAKS